jgi:acylphosphatase
MRSAVMITVTGRVQGVGFRAFVRRAALSLELQGWVRNRRDGSVEILAIGESMSVERLVEACNVGPPLAQPDQVICRAADDDGSHGFSERETL